MKNILLKVKYTRKYMALFLLLIIALTGCSSDVNRAETACRITIAEQYGLAYAPLQVMKELKLMEKNLPGVEVSWRQLGNTAAIREAMLANEVDAGFMAVPPFLIGWDKGMEWKIACGLSSSAVGLVTNKDDIKSIKDFTKDDKIAVPQPGSVQHILLSMACEKEFGDAKKLDNQLVTMAHPDGMNALIAGGEITGHFTSPPYLNKELELTGMRQILDGRDIMGGDFTFIVGVSTDRFYTQRPDVHEAFVRSIREAVDYINENPKQVSSMLAEEYGMKESELLEYLGDKAVDYDLTVKGTDKFADFMERNGYISKVPEDMSEIFRKDVKYEGQDENK
jgi:NitT/TauT family transport system substrate-binding protein